MCFSNVLGSAIKSKIKIGSGYFDVAVRRGLLYAARPKKTIPSGRVRQQHLAPTATNINTVLLSC